MTDKNKGLDERQKQLLGNSMAVSAVIIFLYELIIILYKLYKTQDIKAIYSEVILVSTMVISSIFYYIATIDYDSSVERSSREEKLFNKIDERQKRRIIGSLGISAIVASFISLLLMVFKLFYTRAMKPAYTEITLLVIFSITNTLYHHMNREYNIPSTFFGTILPLGDSKKDKQDRLVYYIKDAIRLALVFLVLDIIIPNRIVPISIINSKILLYILNSILSFSTFFIINYLWGEYNVKKRRKFDESLDDDIK